MINLSLFIKAMKSTWIRRIVKSPNSLWATLFRNSGCPIERLLNFAPQRARSIVAIAKNDFWNEVFEIWDFVYNALPKKSMNIFLSPLWHNPMVKRGLYKDEWYKKGITMVGDLINYETGKVKAKSEIENTYGFKIKNFLDYLEVGDVIKRFLDVPGEENKMPEKSGIPNHLIFLIRQEKGCKNIYNILNNVNCENKYRNQWNQDLNIIIDEKTWRRVFYLCFNTILDNKLVWLQYKLLYRILGTNKLYQIGRSKDKVCRICKSDTETLVHLFVTCETVRQLWSDLNNWVGHSLNKQLSNKYPLKSSLAIQ